MVQQKYSTLSLQWTKVWFSRSSSTFHFNIFQRWLINRVFFRKASHLKRQHVTCLFISGGAPPSGAKAMQLLGKCRTSICWFATVNGRRCWFHGQLPWNKMLTWDSNIYYNINIHDSFLFLKELKAFLSFQLRKNKCNIVCESSENMVHTKMVYWGSLPPSWRVTMLYVSQAPWSFKASISNRRTWF